VDAATPSFPRATAFWWYGCKDATKGTLGNLSGNYNSGDGASSEQNDDHGLTVDDLILDAGEDDDKTANTNSYHYPRHSHHYNSRHAPFFNLNTNNWPVNWN